MTVNRNVKRDDDIVSTFYDSEAESAVDGEPMEQEPLMSIARVPTGGRVPKRVVETRNPGVNDDLTEGIQPGDDWVNTTGGTVWICTDNTTGAAAWLQVT